MPQGSMSIKFKKVALITLVIPASIHWLGMCLFGLAIFAHGAFRDLPSFFLTLVTLVGLFSLIVAIVSVARYPKISQFTVYTIGLGCAALVIALCIGFYDEPRFLVSAISLFLGSAFIMVEYVKGT
jgi:peptidoglycan/LPS O-acetylase OafA/YrhL